MSLLSVCDDIEYPQATLAATMRSSDKYRIESQLQHARIVDMHFALQRLRSVVSFMNSGAHPDDETSAMLAALGFRDGIDISYACANRGEGGQNDIGTETGAALGTLRTAEMERAADALNMRLYWLSSHTEDSIYDFRFSKSGVETLAKWGHKHTLERFVSIIRREKPDVLCPTFLDIPGQHGHHRAMTQLAHEAMEAAADDSYAVSHNNRTLPAWRVAKLYLPAWGGGGNAYDDELPPPEASLIVEADGIDDVTGWSWEQIGQQSRRYHLTQGMGRWVAPGTERNWPLHLAYSIYQDPDTSITSNLPVDLAALADTTAALPIKNQLLAAQMHINAAIEAYPVYDKILLSANNALSEIRIAQQNCPPEVENQILHRLQRKVDQLSTVIRTASGIEAHAIAEKCYLRPGEQTACTMEVRQPEVKKTIECSHSVSIKADNTWAVSENSISASNYSVPGNPYPEEYFPGSTTTLRAELELVIDGVTSTTQTEVVNSPVLLSERVVNLSSNTVVLNRQAGNKTFSLGIESRFPASAALSLKAPDGWSHTVTEKSIEVQIPDQTKPGTYELDVLLDGQPAQTEQLISYDHISPRALTRSTTIKVLVLDVNLPDARIAYVGGGNDRVVESIAAMGFDVTELDDKALQSGRDLNQFDTLVIGLFAMKTRPALAQNLSSVYNWIENGGHLLTLYHRPWDNWNPDTTPPRFLEIGKPSLRFRVTDEKAEVTHLLPEHPLLNHPNKITAADWQHWCKERGLYFAKSWHEDYQALLSMHDPDEQPLTGSLLSANIGNGRHTHTSLVLHHQMANLVPGSFRLMANLLS